ncbi:MAG: hypothetical protein AAFQ98_22570 [Bacteroidota bacterium]
MIVLFILVGLLLLLVLGVLLLPLSLVVDSQKGQYQFCVGRWLTFRLITWEGLPAVEVKAPFYRKVYDVKAMKALSKKRKDKKEPRKRKRKRWKVKQVLQMLANLRDSFQVKQLRIVINTGNPVWNAWMYPLPHLLSMPASRVQVAFHAPSRVVLHVENRVGRMGWAVARVFIFKPSK